MTHETKDVYNAVLVLADNGGFIAEAVNSYDAAQAMAEALEGLILAELGSRDKAKAALSAFRKATGEGE